MTTAQSSRVAGLILAAGTSSRLGRAKQLLVYQGQTLLSRIVDHFGALPLQDIGLVYGARRMDLAAELGQLEVAKVYNPDWATGMGSSLRTGLQLLLTRHPDLDAILVALVDQPLLTARHFTELLRIYEQHPGALVAAAYEDVLGVPAIFPRSCFPDLLTQNGQVGAKKILKKYAYQVIPYPCPEAAFDIDTEADYQRLLAR